MTWVYIVAGGLMALLMTSTPKRSFKHTAFLLFALVVVTFIILVNIWRES